MKTIAINQIIIPDEKSFLCNRSDNLDDLLNDIKNNGILCPIKVKKENGNLILVDGLRRIKACEKLGIEQIPYKMYRRKRKTLIKAIVKANLSDFNELT